MYLNLVGHSGGFHPRRSVHGVAEQAVAWRCESDHTCGHRAGVETDADHHDLFRTMLELEVADELRNKQS